MRLRLMIVDDEPLAQRRLMTLLREHDDVDVVGSAGDGESALAAIRRLDPDIVLLDVKMPGASGVELLAALGPRPPAVIFVTAFSDYAADAFALAATDYLLKPIEPARLSLALERARERLATRGSAEQIAELQQVVAQLRARGAPQDSWAREIWVAHRSERISVPVAEVDWVKAERDYVRIFAGTATHLHRETIEALERRLDPALFVRVHRSALVAKARVRRIRTQGGRTVLSLSTGADVPVSRRYAPRVRAMFAAREQPG